MAVLAQTKTTSDAIGNREDLSDKIVRIYADEMPMQAMAKTVKAKAVDHDWLTTDIRKGVLGNAQPEGFRATQTAAKLRKRLRNKCQIPTEGGSVSATQEATDKAGIKSEYKEQKRLKLTEYNLDIEATICSAQQFRDQVGTADGEGRLMSGIQCFVSQDGNTSRGDGGLDPTYDANGYAQAPTAGTNRTFTEQQLKDVLLGMYQNGAGGNKVAMMGAELKVAASGFTGLAEHRVNVPSAKATYVIAAVDEYVSDFGNVGLMAHQSELANECLVVQSKVIQIAKLRPTTTKPLPIAGSSREFFVDGECTLKITNPKGLGIIADVNAA